MFPDCFCGHCVLQKVALAEHFVLEWLGARGALCQAAAAPGTSCFSALVIARVALSLPFLLAIYARVQARLRVDALLRVRHYSQLLIDVRSLHRQTRRRLRRHRQR